MDFDTVFDFVYSMALSDAMNRVSGAGEKERIAECDDIKQSVRTHARMIIFNENADNKREISGEAAHTYRAGKA